VIHEQNLVRSLLNGAGDALPMLLAEDERSEDEEIERALEEGDTIGRVGLG
jgi:hypothetical protein